MKRNRNKKEIDFCLDCGKGEFRRDLASFDPACESGGRNEKCDVCGTLYWVSADASRPLEKLVPADQMLYSLPDDEAFKVFGSAEKFLEFVEREWKEKEEKNEIFSLQTVRGAVSDF